MKKWLLLILFPILIACSEPKQDRLPSEAVILAFGDSLTHGVGASDSQDYPSVLAELTGMQVINAGISGETTTSGVLRFQSVLDQHSPQLVILMEGGNDIIRKHDLKKTQTNLAKMIQTALSRQIKVVLVGVPEKKLFANTADFYQELANQHDVIYEGDLLPDLLYDNQYKSDPIHLNAKGYRKFAEGLHQLLMDKGVL
ncbi:MAG: GDSL-type esterase/lipase family protein [Gammaproteobacteria bacterium]|nr:GDSL-type esterase/lipase family protein [Gammaproteobacteria bacterium]MDH5630455.1 GDSL-type esterase/lipase family protein [Gammaproteobacteria bacterium]